MVGIPRNDATGEQDGSADDPLLVFIERARCPACGSTNLLTQRSTRHGDEAVERRTRCRACGLGFTVIVE